MLSMVASRARCTTR
jgi:Tol biopolymer transport system component